MRAARLVLALALGLLSACAGGDQEPESSSPLLIHCAASLGGAMEEAARSYAQRDGIALPEINTASSLLLRKQIEADAPGDVFVAAAPSHVDILEETERIDPETRVELLRNRLALLVSIESGIDALEELASPDRWVGLASEGVPVGDYARDLLRSAGLWDAVSSSVILFPHEPAVYQAVKRKLVPAAFVYGSTIHGLDAELLLELRIDPRLQPAISYPAVVLTKSRQARQARSFLKYLQSPDGQAIFERHGFIPLLRS